MKICAMSDLHSHWVPILQKCDVLVFAGDVSRVGGIKWWDEVFLEYLELHNRMYDKCIMVFGNHDDDLQIASIKGELNVPDNVVVLNNESFKYKGVNFFGSPFIKESKAIIESKLMFSEQQLRQLYVEMPIGTDVLITHQPPYGFGDTVVEQSYHLGSMALMDRIRVVRPKIHFFGHIHTGKKYEEHNGTKFYNVSVLNEKYQQAYKPTIINI